MGPGRGQAGDALTLRSLGLAALVLGTAMILAFGDLMIGGSSRVVSKIGCDIFSGTLAGREVVFDQLRQGHFMLWNPFLLGGCPNFGGFQSWLVYPLAFPHLCLSAAAAINWGFILHTWLGALFMYAWLGRQGLHRLACLAGAIMFAFCAPLYLRLYAGHPTVHAAIAWIPMVFLAIEGIVLAPTLGWLLLGTAVVSLQLLAGYPQILFYTAIAAGLYALARLPESPRPGKSLLLLALMNVGVLALTAVQWTAGLAMADECVRRGGVPYAFAAMFSLPPENALTLIRPGLFGNMENFPYWGRCYLWEMCLYFGTIGLFFAVAGLGHARRRQVLIAAGLALFMGILALGSHAPYFPFFYRHVPGFDLFRCNAKFIALAVVFLIFLSAHGLDALLRATSRRWTVGLLLGAVATCGALALLMGGLAFGPSRAWVRFMALPLGSGEVDFDPAAFAAPEAMGAAAKFAVGELRLALCFLAVLAVLLGALWRRPQQRPRIGTGIVGLLALELLLFAWSEKTSFSPGLIRKPELNRFLNAHLGESRVLSADGSNRALSLNGVCDLWGYGSDAVIRRYAEFLAFTQGENPDQVTGYQPFTRLHPRFDLLRCKYVLAAQADGTVRIREARDPLPRFFLVCDWRVQAKRDEVFTALVRPDFRPRDTVFLERAPAGVPAAAGSASGRIRLLRESTDGQDVEVTLPRPAILVQSDLYTPNWRVRALPGSVQMAYELIPADYILRAVPLQAGTHRLRIEYRPSKFVVGRNLSLAALPIFLGLTVFWGVRKRRQRS